MKSILISIKPKYVAKILNREKTTEIRKTAPKCELPIDVYIYCTKGAFMGYLSKKYVGKVVAKFTLRKVEKLKIYVGSYIPVAILHTDSIPTCSLMEKESCLTMDEIWKYTKTKGYAWHISDLVIFDKPKELGEFKQSKLPWPDKFKFGIPWEERYYYALGKFHTEHLGKNKTINEIRDEFDKSISIKHAPQSWCYVEKTI